jgi:hypothetical protein
MMKGMLILQDALMMANLVSSTISSMPRNVMSLSSTYQFSPNKIQAKKYVQEMASLYS